MIRPHKGTQINDPLPTKLGKPVDQSVHPMARAMGRAYQYVPVPSPATPQSPQVKIDEDDSQVTGIN